MTKEVWSLIEIENEKLHNTSLKMAAEATRGAKLLNGTSCGVLFGPPSCLKLMQDNNNYGLEKIYFFETKKYVYPEMVMSNLSALVLEKKPELILFASTSAGAEIGARLAAKLKKGLISNSVDFELKKNKLIARKALYGGKAHATYTWCTEPPYIATVELDSLEAVEAKQKIDPEIISVKVITTQGRLTLKKSWQVPLSELDITEASLVVGVGNGIDTPESMDQVKRLAELLGGVVAGSRVAVFRGFISVDQQIGSTGKFIKSDIYLPIGISGSTRHSSGIKNVAHVIPINLNKDAPIFKFAEIGSVDDLHEVVPRMLEILEQQKDTAGGMK
jgi:electron transfer flavoprotein alpha subunit